VGIGSGTRSFYKKHATCHSILVSDLHLLLHIFFSFTTMGFLSLKKPDDEVGAAWPSIMVGAFAAFAGILYGYDTGKSSNDDSRVYNILTG
jgi:hypothetical protein